MKKEKFMKAALKEAQKAYLLDEVPIGCVIVKDDKIISRGYNKRNTSKNSINHAEVIAIQKACKKLKDWRLENCDIYITLEPCPMCTGAIVNARLSGIYFGAFELKSGSCLSNFKIPFISGLNHKCTVEGGILEQECSNLLKNYFKSKRKDNE